MNKFTGHKVFTKKAGVSTCLFLLMFGLLPAQDWTFDERTRTAYHHVLDLDTRQAVTMLPHPSTPQDQYVVLLAHSIEMLVGEDYDLLATYEEFAGGLVNGDRDQHDPHVLFIVAEAHLQWAFVSLKFGDEFAAVSHLREAYRVTETTRKKFPGYVPIRKTYGLLQTVIGAVPEKYTWLLALLGMEGSIRTGLTALRDPLLREHDLGTEATLLHGLLQGFVLQRPDSALLAIEPLLIPGSHPHLTAYLATLLAMKNSQSDRAFSLLDSLDDRRSGLPLHYAEYLKGEIHLQRAEYPKAIASFRNFTDRYVGRNFIKDAWYKMGICYWLNDQVAEAQACFRRANNEGTVVSEADRSAAAALAEHRYPNKALAKARYAMDGGYFSEARAMLAAVTRDDLRDKRDQVEYFYRKARLEHLTHHKRSAMLFYRQTIGMAGRDHGYFAPNACLQMGYLYLSDNNIPEAKKYFRQALTYRHHAYENSIDSKARSALNRLR